MFPIPEDTRIKVALNGKTAAAFELKTPIRGWPGLQIEGEGYVEIQDLMVLNTTESAAHDR